MSEFENDRDIKVLNDGIDRAFDIFIYGDKQSGTKPGNIQVYGAIAGMRQVKKERIEKKREEEQLGR